MDWKGMLSAAAFMTAIMGFTSFMLVETDKNLKFMLDALRTEMIYLIRTVERHDCILYPEKCWPEGR